MKRALWQEMSLFIKIKQNLSIFIMRRLYPKLRDDRMRTSIARIILKVSSFNEIVGSKGDSCLAKAGRRWATDSKNISRLMRYHTCGFYHSLARALFRDARERAYSGKLGPQRAYFGEGPDRGVHL